MPKAAHTRLREIIVRQDKKTLELDMREGGVIGDEVTVTGNGTYTLPGFADSAVSSPEIKVDHYLALWSMIRNEYSGRLADVLDVTV